VELTEGGTRGDVDFENWRTPVVVLDRMVTGAEAARVNGSPHRAVVAFLKGRVAPVRKELGGGGHVEEGMGRGSARLSGGACPHRLCGATGSWRRRAGAP
jgi:hypothetical protein